MNSVYRLVQPKWVYFFICFGLKMVVNLGVRSENGYRFRGNVHVLIFQWSVLKIGRKVTYFGLKMGRKNYLFWSENE